MREAATKCVCELHRHLGDVVTDAIYASTLRPAQQREVFLQLDAPPVVVKSAPASRKNSASSSLNNHTTNSRPGSTTSVDESRSGAGNDPDAEVHLSVGRQAGAAAPAAAAGKRGGYKDGGGVSLDGELMAVAPIAVVSERELKSDMENLTMLLAQVGLHSEGPRILSVLAV